MNEISILAIDLAKNVFELCGKDAGGRTVLRKRLARSKLAQTVAQLPCCTIAMEACGGAHAWGRQFTAMGHSVALLPAYYVRAFRQGGKNDSNDAAAIAEAAARPERPRVALKSESQQGVLTLHRIRAGAMKSRTAVINQLRGLLAEFGIVLPAGVTRLRQEMPRVLNAAPIEAMVRDALLEQYRLLTHLDANIADINKKLDALSRTEPLQRLLKVPGVGPLTATAFAASVGDAKAFRNGRQVAAWLGLTPRQHSSGERTRLLGISKRGDAYLRTLLIHGARAAVKVSARSLSPRNRWIQALVARAGANVAAVALANKNARILWALMAHDQPYRPS